MGNAGSVTAQSSGRKVVSKAELLELRQASRAAGKRVVHCHGCFDIVHPGHIQHLEYARSLGDILVVSVSADAQVGKGVNRPLIPDDLRAGSLAALACVDIVYINPTPTAVELLEQLRPDIFVKGREYETSTDPRFLAEQTAVLSGGGRVVFASGEVIFSSTALINSLTQTAAFDAEKLSRFRQRFDLTDAAISARLRRMHGLKALVVGDYIRDRYVFCSATGVASESPMLSLQTLGEQSYDGGAAVIARHLAALGATTTLLTSLPQHEAADLASRLRPQSITLQTVPTRPDAIVKDRFLVDTQKVMKLDHGLPSPADTTTHRLMSSALLEAAAGCDLLIFADFGYGTISPVLLDSVLPQIRPRVGTISADVSGRATTLTRFTGVDLLCPTEREMRQSLQDFSSSLNAAAWNLLSRTSARQLAVTLGKQGVVALDRPAGDTTSRLRAEHIPALAAHAVDPLGCGDVFLATTSLTLAAGGSLQEATLLGSLAAAHHCMQLGNPAIDVTAVSRLLASLPEPMNPLTYRQAG